MNYVIIANLFDGYGKPRIHKEVKRGSGSIENARNDVRSEFMRLEITEPLLRGMGWDEV